ncbi:type IV pilus inner membrane component PilO [Rubrivivax albus]|uniref:Pilus assembly protein PilO n=1 Tax=Rubrivivax albus TaxID=2499835 RepID=A0A437JZD7_9BURK|nr:type 4a pilus biogenesis protein PilO [Rubrivivax albus]RVT53419.1 pilus assembly protein PilO [Rubrivivax albus]
MAKASSFNIDIASTFDRAASQFRGLDTNEPGQWPLLPKVAAWVLAGVAVVAAGWWFVVSGAQEELDAEIAREQPLRSEFRDKLRQAVNLGELRKQKLQVEEYVIQLEKQLPGKAEMDALLSDINQAGLGRGLQFELFRPGNVEVKDHYAVLPISVRVSGRYHDIGAFVADVANLSRIVTLHNLVITRPGRDPNVTTLTMEATARTYRYLDQAEIDAQKKAKADASKANQKRARK